MLTSEAWHHLRRHPAWADIDRVFADFIVRYAQATIPAAGGLAAAALLASRAVRLGHSCVDLAAYADRLWEDSDIKFPPLNVWTAALQNAPRAVTTARIANPDAPLVLDEAGRLYLARFFGFEKSIAAALRARAAQPFTVPVLAPGTLRELSGYFRRRAAGTEMDFQQLAVLTAAASPLTVISGGPGTGKTTVVAALLALELSQNPALRVRLAAPTGKAQARLAEALAAGAPQLNVPPKLQAQIAALPCSTLHALLGVRRGSRDFRHNRENPLCCDILIIDEGSMVPLALLAALLDAVPPEAKLILLGDPYQLASVEAGAVMADICEAGSANRVPPAVAAEFARQTAWRAAVATDTQPLSGHIIELTENHRFASRAMHIGAVATAIRQRADAATLAADIAALREPDFESIHGVGTAQLVHAAFLKPRVRDLAWRDLAALGNSGRAADRETMFELLDSFRMLAPMRNGERGVDNLNRLARCELGITATHAPGLPIMITANDWKNSLCNGDVGVIAREAPDSPVLRAYFPGNPRAFLLSELPGHEDAAAMTVHKSQGSGFNEVVLALPEKPLPNLSCELLYTAVTRAVSRVELWGSAATVRAALLTRTRRASGLADRLRD